MCSARKEFCQAGIFAGRNFARKGFCQAGILSGRNFVRQEFCQEGILSGRNFVRKRALPGRRVSFGVVCVVYFLFLGARGESASGGAKGDGGESALGVSFFGGGGRVSFFRLACPTSFDTCRKCALSGSGLC